MEGPEHCGLNPANNLSIFPNYFDKVREGPSHISFGKLALLKHHVYTYVLLVKSVLVCPVEYSSVIIISSMTATNFQPSN